MVRPVFLLRRLPALLLTILGLALVLSACGKRETNVQRGNREQILHRGINPDIGDLDPHLASTGADYNVLSALFEGLLTEHPVNLRPIAGVAESWTLSPDQLTYTFELRKNAVWSNGDPVTAQDFVRSFQRALSPSFGAEYAWMLHVILNAEAYHAGRLTDFSKVGVSAAGPHTLRLRLEYPSHDVLAYLTHPVCWPVHAATIEKYGPFAERGNGWARPGQFVGNGPFVLKEWRHGQKLVVEKAPRYWDAGNVRLNGIHFHFIESRDAEERAFRSGQLHLSEAVPPTKIDLYRQKEPGLLRIDAYSGTEFYRVNVARPFLNDRRVRRALALAIDRKAITENILRGGQTPAHSLTPPDTDGYASRSSLPHDPAAARALLAEAGYAEGKGAPPIDLLFNPSESHRAVAEAIQEMWRRELGLETKLVQQEFKTLVATRRTGDFQVLRSVWIPDYLSPISYLGVFASTSGNNYTGWSNPSYDQLLFEARRLADPRQRDVLLQKAEALLLDDAPILPIYHYTHVFLLQPSVRNWHANLLDHHPYKYVYLESP